MEEPSASLTDTSNRQVLPVLITSIVYLISSPAPATRSTPLARAALRTEKAHDRRKKGRKRILRLEQRLVGLCKRIFRPTLGAILSSKRDVPHESERMPVRRRVGQARDKAASCGRCATSCIVKRGRADCCRSNLIVRASKGMYAIFRFCTT